jgi:5-carboxymethyl-2-hydroxymuconate isomerase
MPHLTIEYSSNLEERLEFEKLSRRIMREMIATDLFELGSVRVRAIRCDHYAIADEAQDNAFIDMSLRIGAGRTLEDRKRVGEAIFSAAVEELASMFATPHFALSFEIREIDPMLSWKKNAIHPRLRTSAPQPSQR